MQALSEGIYTKLTSVQTAGTVYALTGGRIYDTFAPHEIGSGSARTNPSFPYLVFSVIADPEDRGYSHTSQSAIVQFDLFGEKRSGKEAVGDINAVLHSFINKSTITVSGHDRGVVTCDDQGVPSIEEDAIVVTSIYTVQATEFS